MSQRKKDECHGGVKRHGKEIAWSLRPTPGWISGQAFSRIRTRICSSGGSTDWSCSSASRGYKFTYIECVCWGNVLSIRTGDYPETVALALLSLTSLWTLISPPGPHHCQATDSSIALPFEPHTHTHTEQGKANHLQDSFRLRNDF